MKYTPRILLPILLLAGLLFGGCSTLPRTSAQSRPPLRTYENLVDSTTEHPLEVYDPLEGINRGTYRFNYYFDRYLFLPVVTAYDFILPDYAEDRISNFVDNVFEFNNLFNNILQLKFKGAGITLSRFVINSTVGIGGLWDPATTWGLHKQPEDFGQTLGHYGAGNGPYLVLPILGPSNLRDTFGIAGDAASFAGIGPVAWAESNTASRTFTGVSTVDRRHRQSFRYYQTGSPFEYEMVRLFYTKKRELEIAR
ncbi:VacJ family lipoprotein [Syntrophotalea carbinolica DSM 2380]|uniref:VacJ family lipoprotein n=1 Tax=Syntrophotalea carbinolica (strain DSM 2380 / NBRC 103641 / GraBd1) TaxID=338963 RepID=Q3A3N9_SYNC1|nr:VacJ family lipoprotein [Syntrophotalea carbinolica]ABA89018.1 VacJ family lipoprotein [Syntrophotalea carbinolica DSM 2380]